MGQFCADSRDWDDAKGNRLEDRPPVVEVIVTRRIRPHNSSPDRMGSIPKHSADTRVHNYNALPPGPFPQTGSRCRTVRMGASGKNRLTDIPACSQYFYTRRYILLRTESS